MKLQTPSQVESQGGRPPGAFWLLAGGMALLFGAVLRVYAGLGDLWLDEIWSIKWKGEIKHWWDVVLTVHHDNNHALNTWWVCGLGEGRPDLLYRIPAIVAGVAAIVLAGLIAREQGRQVYGSAARPGAEARGLAVGAILFAASYMMIHYSSEARGYAPALAFALLATYAALRGRGWGWSGWTPVYWAAVALALLGHPLAVHVWGGVLTWQAADALRRGDARQWLGRAARFALWQGPPLAFFTCFYWFQLRLMKIGGGPQLSPWLMIGNACAYTLGLPTTGSLYVALPAAAGVMIAGLAVLVWRERVTPPPVSPPPVSPRPVSPLPVSPPPAPRDPSDPPGREGRLFPRLWAFYLGGILLSPILLTIVTHNKLLFERYFLMSLAMLLLLAALGLEQLARCGRAGVAATAALLAIFAAANHLGHTERLLWLGRGTYREAMVQIANNSSAEAITVGGNHEMAVGGVMEFYAQQMLPPGRRIVYLETISLYPPQGPQWWIKCWQWQDAPPAERIGSLRLVKTYEYAAMSGFNWSVYLNTAWPPEGAVPVGPGEPGGPGGVPR